jgi:hypothetical protein
MHTIILDTGPTTKGGLGWCETNRMRPPATGGCTSLDNGVLLCDHHHRVVETGDWQVGPGADGRPAGRDDGGRARGWRSTGRGGAPGTMTG